LSGSKTKIETSKATSPSRARSQSPGKGGKKGGKKDSEKPPSPKKETKLKKRGEDSEDIETIGMYNIFILIFSRLNSLYMIVI